MSASRACGAGGRCGDSVAVVEARDWRVVLLLENESPVMSIIALAAWIGGVAISFYNGNVKLPLSVLLIGVVLLFAPIGFWSTVGICLLAAVIWIANKADMM